MQCFRAGEVGKRVLRGQVVHRLDGQAGGPGIDSSGIEVPAMLVRLPAMKAGSLKSGELPGKTACKHVRGHVRGVFQMMAQRSYRVFYRGTAMRIGYRPQGWIPNRRRV